MKRYAVIVAGGSASRFGGPVPKQFELLAGKPVLFYSIGRFAEAGAEVVVVLPPDADAMWAGLCSRYGLRHACRTAAGGDTRSRSVAVGLALAEPPGLVAVHDAARPLVSAALVETVYREAAAHGNAVPAVPVDQALRLVEKDGSRAVDRERYRLVQTPQCFDTALLKEAYRRFAGKDFPDDASLYEQAGHDVFLVPGEAFNIKITGPADLQLAETLIRGSIV